MPEQRRSRRGEKLIKEPSPALVCPVHGSQLFGKNTLHGKRFTCPHHLCTVVGWGDSASTPADAETRTARVKAYGIFNPLYHGVSKAARGRVYKALSVYMKKPLGETSIGQFDAAECRQVEGFVFQYNEKMIARRMERGSRAR